MLADMYFLFLGLLTIAASHQLFRESDSDEYCPKNHTMYMNVSAASSVSCAVHCEIDKERCSRFVYDKIQEDCMLYQEDERIEVGAYYTSGGRSLYLRSHKGCDIGYIFDSDTNACIKVYDERRNWNDARQRCQEDGGYLVSMPTRAKWDLVSTLCNCSSDAFWIGLNNATWSTGETFDNVYGLDPKTIHFPTIFDAGKCMRVKFILYRLYAIFGINCEYKKRFVCELSIPN